MSLKNIAEEYFSKINTMANRLYVDMQETKTAYEDLWNTLSHKEQEQVLSESIIKPEISLRYNDTEYKAIQEQYATKLIVDDNCSFQDEHSGPFSFKTPSQRDLTIFIKNEEKREIAQAVKTNVRITVA